MDPRAVRSAYTVKPFPVRVTASLLEESGLWPSSSTQKWGTPGGVTAAISCGGSAAPPLGSGQSRLCGHLDQRGRIVDSRFVVQLHDATTLHFDLSYNQNLWMHHLTGGATYLPL